MKYASNVKNVSIGITADDGQTEEQWHQYAIGDTGTSHSLPGRLYVVQCEWCPEAFAAHTKAEAMVMFRKHETEMLNPQSEDGK